MPAVAYQWPSTFFRLVERALRRYRLGHLVAEGRLTLRVAETCPPERAAEAERKLDAGAIRGRLVIVF